MTTKYRAKRRDLAETFLKNAARWRERMAKTDELGGNHAEGRAIAYEIAAEMVVETKPKRRLTTPPQPEPVVERESRFSRCGGSGLLRSASGLNTWRWVDCPGCVDCKPVETSRTPVETALCQTCGHEGIEHRHRGWLPSLDCDACAAEGVDFNDVPFSRVHLFKPVPPSPEEEQEEVFHTFLPVNGHPDDDECAYRPDGTDVTYCGLPQSAHFEPEPVSPPLQEGGGANTKLVSYILNRGYNGSEEGLDAAIAEFEAAIRAEAGRGFVVMTEPESQALARLTSDLASSEAENCRLQTSLEEANAAFKFATEGWRLDKERKQAAEQALKDIRDKSSAPCDGCPDYDDLCSRCIARRALSPSTEAPSEEK